MQLAKILTPERILVPIPAGDKVGVITALIDLLAQTDALANRDTALQAVLKRESERTTGIGYGLAIPHGKTDGVKSLVIAAGKPAGPVDFQSLDGRPVTFTVLLVSPPDQTGTHIQALAKISRLMSIEGFREAVLAAATGPALFEAIRKFEGQE